MMSRTRETGRDAVRPLLLALLIQAAVPGCVPIRYTGVSGINGYHASLPEARQYWRAKGYDFGPETDTVPRMEEIAAIYTPQQWANRVNRRTSRRREESTVDIDGSMSVPPTGITSLPVSGRQPSSRPATADVPPPVRKSLPPLE